jgi:threonine dehydrogenase-like Zn-dependent dehydrogenase
MVTHRFAIAQAPEAFALFDTGNTGKVVFAWP